ncbi:helix-turn-helix domain-containing protein [Actinoplanes sp. NPDC051513]|uniref:helix-turn-helix domain-containing protein n=1 Tax=Actinoplanes sp. NPDC051513 TaxID=3363908 RepID=UPI0037A5669A
MTHAIPDPAAREGVAELVDRLRANRLPPPAERRAIRKRADVTLDDVAKALGVEKMTVSRWERGVRQPWPKNRAAYICLLQALAKLDHDLGWRIRETTAAHADQETAE